MRPAVIVLVLRRELRRQVAAYVGLALIVALGGGVAIGSLVVAHRSDRAYTDYIRDAEVVDLVVNPSLPTRAMDRAMRQLPGVADVHSDSLLAGTVALVGPGPATVAKVLGSDPSLVVRGSTDGRYQEVDRPIVSEGRFASGDHEVFVNDEYRPALEATVSRRLEVGDTIEMAFWGGLLEDLPSDAMVEPIGVERLRVAGFGRFPDEVLPDELYPRQRLVVSADVARRYTCRAELRAAMGIDEASAAVYPEDCARQYDFYAMKLRPGHSKTEVRRAFAEVADRLTGDIPPDVRDLGVSYVYLSQDRTAVDQAVRQVTQPTVAALTVFGLVAGAATLAVTALAVSRILRRGDAQQRSLRAMGATRGQLARLGASPPLAAGCAGLIGAVPVAFVMSIAGPTGSVRAVTPSPGFALPGRVVVSALVVIGSLFVVSTLALAWAVAARAGTMLPRREHRPWVTRLLVRTGRPAAAQGVRTALSTRGADGGGVALAGCVVALAAITAAVVFGTNLTALVQDRDRYGWEWDAAVITNGGYGDTRPAKVAASLDGNAAVDDYALFAFDASSRIGGRPVPTVYGFPGAERTAFPLVEGRQAARPGEAVLGAKTAAELGVSVGDRVPAVAPVSDLESVDVVGIGVLPSLGPLLADRAGLGTGAFVLVDTDPADRDNQYPATLTAIRLRPGIDAPAFLATLDPAPASWDAQKTPPYTYSAPARPAEIVNADSMQTTPLALGGVLVVGLMIGLALAIGVSVRDRRRELAILRSLGFDRRDLRATVAWQAITTIVVGLVVGLPLGVVAGRFAWRAFADQLGVVPRADVPYGWLAVIATLAVVAGLLAAATPARAAARIRPSDVLNDAP